MSENQEGNENLQWKCPGCYQINEIDSSNCTKCDQEIPKDYQKFQKMGQEQNKKENEKEEEEIKNQQKLIKDKLQHLNQGGSQDDQLGKNISEQFKDSLQLNHDGDSEEQKQNNDEQKQNNIEKQNLDKKVSQNESSENQQNNNSQSSEDEEEKNEKEEVQVENDNNVEKNLEEALKKKDEGAQYFKQGHWKQAIEEYEDAIDFCPEEEKKTLSILYSNLGICNIKLELWEEAISHCSKSISLDTEYRKPYLNRAIAYEKSEREEEALEDLKSVLKMNPSDKQLQIQIFRLEKKVKEVQEKRKKEVLSGLKDLGNSLLGKFGMSLDNFKLQQTENGGYTVNFNK